MEAIIETIGSNEIMNMLPHRYPFLMLDRVVEIIPGKYAKGIKNVTIAEPVFQGHFPKEPIFPGALVIEALAQLCAIAYGYNEQNETSVQDLALSELVGYLAEVKQIRFKKKIIPGDQIVLEAQLSESYGNIMRYKVTATVDEGEVASGILTVTSKQ